MLSRPFAHWCFICPFESMVPEIGDSDIGEVPRSTIPFRRLLILKQPLRISTPSYAMLLWSCYEQKESKKFKITCRASKNKS